MARASDLGRKRSGLSYARAARKFGVTIEDVRAYAQMAKDFNRQQKAVAKEYGYKGELRQFASLKGLAEDAEAIRRFGARGFFEYVRDEVMASLQDVPRLEFENKAEQYHANMIQALTNNAASAFEESEVALAIDALKNMTPKEVMRMTGGKFFDFYYGRKQPGKNEMDADDMVTALAEMIEE